MDQNASKLLRYVVDSDGLLDARYARLIFASEFTVEFFEEYNPSTNEFVETTESLIFEFAQEYFNTYGVPPTEDALINEMLTRSDMQYVRKQTISKQLRIIGQFEISENEFSYIVDRVREVYVTAKAIQVMHSGMDTIKVDPIKGVEAVQRNLADVLARAVVSSNTRDRTLQLSQFADYLLTELDSHGELMHGGIKYPFQNFNDALGGLYPGELVVIAGMANSGKSMLGRAIAYYAGLDCHLPVVCADREMLHDQQGVRFLSYLTCIPQRKIKNASLQTPAERALLQEALAVYADTNNPDSNNILFIPPVRCANTLMIRREIEAQWGKKRPKLIIADYLNEFEPTRRAEGWEAKERVLHDLKQLALYFECPVVTMAQTNDKGATQYKAVRHICDTLIIISEDADKPYIHPSGPGVYVGTPGRLNCYVDKARNDSKDINMPLEVEFATVSIKQDGVSSNNPVVQAIVDHTSTPYDDKDDDMED